MNRRDFMTIGTSVLSLPYMGGFADALPPAPKNDRAVIYLFLGGGASHYEFNHTHPSKPEGQKSVLGSIQTKIEDFYISGLWDGLAQRADRLNWIQGYSHGNSNHLNSTLWQLSGRVQNQLFQTEPAIGALATRMLGPTNPKTGLPTYVCNARIDGDAGAWAGNHNIPFEANDKGLRDLTINIPLDRFQQRMDFIKTIDKQRSFIGQQMWTESNKLRQQATELLVGNARAAFEVKNEPESIRKQYGETNIGNSLLMARRLIQNGSKYIQLAYSGWDLHTNIKQGSERLIPPLDKAISAFIDDTTTLGMDKDVLLVISTDFGRTTINVNAGRDHHSNLVPLVIYGGHNDSGRTIGRADSTLKVVEEGRYMPKDVARTILEHLQINPYQQMTDLANRPRFLVDDNSRNILV